MTTWGGREGEGNAVARLRRIEGWRPSDKARRDTPHATSTAPLLPDGLVLGRERGSAACQRWRYDQETTGAVCGVAQPASRFAGLAGWAAREEGWAERKKKQGRAGRRVGGQSTNG